MRRKGFTLVELLAVIAIIAILSAVMFPVFFRARDNAYRSSDISNMNALRSALQIYREDQGAYPPALLGYITLYGSSPGGYVLTNDGAAPLADLSNVVPPNLIKGFMYPRRVDDVNTFRPSYNRPGDNRMWTTAVWPNQAAGGDPEITSTSDDDCAKQLYGPTKTVTLPGSSTQATYYKISGYDVAQVNTPSGIRNEIHYAPFWTGWGLGEGGCALGSGSDNSRQLGYSNPPDTTVVTWNSFYRDYENGVPEAGRREIVLFLGGSARPYDPVTMSQKSWAAEP